MPEKRGRRLQHQRQYPSSVQRYQNRLSLSQLRHPKDISEFLKGVRAAVREGFSELIVDLHNVAGFFPNAVVPLAGLLEHYRFQGVSFSIEGVHDLLERTCFQEPLDPKTEASVLHSASLNRVWRFDDFDGVTHLVDAFVEELSHQVEYEVGIMDGLTWCLNEVMDNVLQHAGSNQGYAMGQVHPNTKHIAFCVYDSGQGIFNSFRGSQHSPRNPVDAITLSIKEDVTRNRQEGQGNGMWGLHQIVQQNSGRLSITSGSASYLMKGNKIRTFSNIPAPSQETGTTTVDFQLDFETPISVSTALGGYQPTNVRLENITSETGVIEYRLVDRSSGTGTRKSAGRVRNDILNLYKESGATVEIDFDRISVVSSSFADVCDNRKIAR